MIILSNLFKKVLILDKSKLLIIFLNKFSFKKIKISQFKKSNKCLFSANKEKNFLMFQSKFENLFSLKRFVLFSLRNENVYLNVENILKSKFW